MQYISLVLTAIAFAMDAFAVSICKGLSVKRVKVKNALCVGLWFGIFQMIMPLVGFYLSNALFNYIEKFDHWIAFILLVIIGANMLREVFLGEEESQDADFSFKTMLVLAIATSIDALAGGVSLAVEKANIFLAISLIGSVTFAFSYAGIYIGNKFGVKYKKGAEIFGGIVLILLGLKIMLEHTII